MIRPMSNFAIGMMFYVFSFALLLLGVLPQPSLGAPPLHGPRWGSAPTTLEAGVCFLSLHGGVPPCPGGKQNMIH